MAKALRTVNPFSGDPVTVDFFCEQATDFIKINNIGSEEALAFVKSCLQGAALQWYAESPELKKITDHKTFLNKLKDFFAKPVTRNAHQEFNSIMLLPNENIPSLAHRLRLLASIVYPDLDDNALQKILLVQFYQALPASIKIKLIEKEPKNFDEAVSQAQELFISYAKHNMLNVLIDTPSSSLATIHALQNNVSDTKNKNDKRESRREMFKTQRRFRDNRENSKRGTIYKNNSNSYSSRYPVVECQFCGRRGHTLKFCRTFKKQYGEINFQNYSQQHGQRNRPFNRNQRNFENSDTQVARVNHSNMNRDCNFLDSMPSHSGSRPAFAPPQAGEYPN